MPNAAMVTYPVRGIRRKNVGEMLLWSAVAKSFATFCITLRPLNPAEAVSYDRWQQLAQRLALHCRFDIGAASSGMRFEEIVAASDNVMTTSVAEGFGMVFLEAHLFARPLLGRDLPEITSQFKQAGLVYPLLAERMRIPRHLVDCRRARGTLVTCFREVAEAFGHPFEQSDAQRQAEQLCEQETIDFALLGAEQQAELIESVAAPGGPVAGLCDANPVISQFLSSAMSRRHTDMREPTQIIEDNFGLVTSGHRLADLYQRVLASDATAPPCPAPAGDKVLESFLSLPRLHPIRVQ